MRDGDAVAASPPSFPRMSPALRRWTLRVLLTVVALLVAGVASVYALSERRFRASFDVHRPSLAIPTAPAAIAEGARLAVANGCTDCHGDALSGRVVVDEPVVGRIAGSNLTRGGRGAALTPTDWERAVRHGVRRDGSALAFMPAHEFRGMPDDELAMIVAWARTLPAIANDPGPVRAGPLGRVLLLTGDVAFVPAERIDHARPHPAHVEAERTVAYGRYRAEGCVGCHGATLSGGKIKGAPPDWPPAADLTRAGRVGTWSEADFVRALREGVRPDGTRLSDVMPWRSTRAMTDTELGALYLYLRTLPGH